MASISFAIRLFWARVKDKFTTKVPTLLYAPGPCPACGSVIEIPLTRTPMPSTCKLCQTTVNSIAIGLVDVDVNRLMFIHNEVEKRVAELSTTYRESKLQ